MAWFSRKPPWQSSMTLEDRLATLAQCGIRMRPGRTIDELLVSCRRDEYESDPYLLLVCLGGEVEQEPLGRRFCDTLWQFDAECIEDHGDYARIAVRLRDLSAGTLPIAEVADFVDVEAHKASLAFSLNGRRIEWEPEVNDDWVDRTIMSEFAALLQDRRAGRRFTRLDLGGQACLLGCATDDQLAALRKHTGLKWQWLT